MIKTMKDVILSRAQDIIVKSEVEQALSSDQKLRIKLGIDPTGPVLHLGRASVVRRLKNLQDMGHQIVLIVGDFTAKIGDASDKTSERQVLSDDVIKANMADYKAQLGQILDMSKVEFHYNSEWLSKIPLDKFIELAQQFTVAQMIERENYAIRFKENRPIGLHEFLYPILQGYDSIAVKADIEIGGTDQLFNLMAGRTMQKNAGQKPQSVLTFELLTGPDGRKMSTSWGNAIYITDEPNDMYGKLMRINDELIAEYYRICTDVPLDVIEQVVDDIAGGANPRDTKASLAREIVTIYHGEKAAFAAEEAFNAQFREGKLPEDMAEETVSKSKWQPIELLVALKLAESKSDARRLLEQGGVRLNGVQIKQERTKTSEITVEPDDVIQVGKRRFVKLRVKG
ncbi:tyrosine--tRNA ligase [Patescibacteria group bacterium]|nr:MAG: tyrosine--tRNA ligase [Patescibacteria group bacterium]